MDTRPIGFFDSGVGGISVLKRAAIALPREDFVYFGDSARAPYGTLPPEKILEYTLQGARFLLEKRVKMLVIACNTATSAAARELRRQLDIPVVAMEPALKPAQEKRRSGQIIVLATKATLSQQRFIESMKVYGRNAVAAPVFGLVELVERGIICGEAVEDCLRDALFPALDAPTDIIVLGCTHYPFVSDSVRKIARGIPVIDGGEGTVRQIGRVLRERALENGSGAARVDFYSSGKQSEIMRGLYDKYIPE